MHTAEKNCVTSMNEFSEFFLNFLQIMQDSTNNNEEAFEQAKNKSFSLFFLVALY